MHRILIVDDERPARDLLAELVAFYIPDSDVNTAENAYRALDLLRTEDYDLLFVDISMPGLNGLELLEKIHRMGNRIYSFVITAHQKYEYALKGFRLGILDYIEKPLHKDKIHKAAKLYLEKIKSNMLDLRVYTGIRRVPVESVIAIEAAGRGKVKVYTGDSILTDVSDSLLQLYKRLPANFRYIRRDCIINLHGITRYNLKMQALEVFVVCRNEELMFKTTRSFRRTLPEQFNFLFAEIDEK